MNLLRIECHIDESENGICGILLDMEGQFHRLRTIYEPHLSHNNLHKIQIIEARSNSKHHKKMSIVIEDVKARAEVYHGDEVCQVKSKELLKEIALPNGLLPLKEMEECGYDRESGFVWLKQKKNTTHKFEKIGKLVSYGPEVTAHVEHGKIKKLSGVKTKELLLWVSLSDIYVDDPPTGKITFKTPSGLYRSFPVSAFEIEEKTKENKQVNGAGESVQVKEV